MKKFISNTVFKWIGISIFSLVGFATAIYALDYLGVSGVLKQIEERNAQPGQKPKSSEQSKLRDDLKTFAATVTNLAPADAAKQWLAFIDRAAKLQQQSRMNYSPGEQQISADELLAVLPPPSDWNELSLAITSRPPAKKGEEIRETGLRFLADTLTGNTNGQKSEIAQLQAKANDANFQDAYFYNDILEQWSRATLAASDDPDAVLKSLNYEMSAVGKRGPQTLEVPNLVSLAGAEKAEAFLRKALVTPNVLLQFNQPNDTSRLAQKLAMELMSQLKQPQWGLVNSLDSVELYEALDKQFGDRTNAPTTSSGISGSVANMFISESGNDYQTSAQKQRAQIYYMLGLISHNRSKDAVAIAKKANEPNGQYIFDEAFKEMARAGYTDALDDFLYEMLSQDPSLSFWNEYVQTAASAGKTDRMLALIRSSAVRDDLTDEKKAAIQQILFQALLASDKTNEGVAEMRRLISSENSGGISSRYNAGQLGVMLARIGVLENNTHWADEGIDVAKKWLASSAGQNFSDDNAEDTVESLSQILFESQRGPEAEAILADALAAATRAPSTQSRYSWNNYPQQILSQLALLYHKAGRDDDVLNLLQQSPDWGAKDLSELFDTSPWENGVTMMWLHTGSSPTPVPYLAANALIATGQKEQARKIVDDLLLRFPGLDRGYELLLALDGTNAIPQLDELFKRDQFEERPLIWKAHLLRQENRLDEAEKVIRQAISIDPSDGEEGRGDRMRAYTELADILDARGNKKDTDFYREIVKAIRMSEDADQFYQAGLLTRAIAMYEEALTHFSDAYCIQSRLAIQLSALGQNQAAEEHYRRAYELMPDSFGRVESHCFGCERAFDGERAQSIAEQVFTKIAAERPDKPQVYYLLGYLRTEEERYNEARTNFLQAVRLDPDYLNAWVKLQEASKQTLVPAKDRDEIAFNILRLDPLQRHAQPDFDSVTDLPKLWNAVAVAVGKQPEFATNLLTLAASKIAVEKKENNPSQNEMETRMEYYISNRNENLSPARAIAQTPFVQMAGQLILSDNDLSDD